MHYFFTGERQVGKSTIIDKIISATGLSLGGFRTSFGPDRFNYDSRTLYIYDGSEKIIMDDLHTICKMTSKEIFPHPEVFDDLGVKYLKKGLEKKCQIILMDECGRFEKNSMEFQKQIVHTLDEASLVLGVIQIELPPWTKIIYNRPDVKLITVTKENRDKLAEDLILHVRSSI